MEINAVAKNIRISPRKVRLVSGSLKGMVAKKALEYLRFANKSSALPLSKVIKSALSNATNNFKLEEDKLKIKDIAVEEGPTLKRFRARSRGMAHSILKRTSHIKVVLEDVNGPKS